MPSVMSMATEMAVPWAAPATVISRIPGTTYAMYVSRPPARPRPGAERAAEDVHEQQQEHDRDAGDEEGQRRVAAHAAEVAAEHRRRVGQGERIARSSAWSPSRWSSAAGEGQEDVVEVGVSDRQAVDLDRRARRAGRAARAASATPPSLGTCERERLVVARRRRRRRAAARSSSAASANSSRMRPPGTSRLSSAGVPSATSRPWSSTAIRWASRSASSRYWVVRRIVTPSRDEVADDLPHRRGGCADRGRPSARRGR